MGGVARTRIGDGPECPICGSTAWDVGFIAAPPETSEDDPGEGAWVELTPAPMARCAGCGLSARLDRDMPSQKP